MFVEELAVSEAAILRDLFYFFFSLAQDRPELPPEGKALRPFYFLLQTGHFLCNTWIRKLANALMIHSL